jgi:hypothetical protein
VESGLLLCSAPEQFQLRVSSAARASRGVLVMRRMAEYELRAEECRRLAAQTKDPEQKKQLEDMAQGWELLAKARLQHLRKGWGEPSKST